MWPIVTRGGTSFHNKVSLGRWRVIDVDEAVTGREVGGTVKSGGVIRRGRWTTMDREAMGWPRSREAEYDTVCHTNRTYYCHINQSNDKYPSHLRANPSQFQTDSALVAAIHRRYFSALTTSHARSASTTRWRFPDRFCTSQATRTQQRLHPDICTL